MCLGRHCRGHPVHVSQVGRCPHMCPWVGPHAPSFGRQLWGLPSRVEYVSPQGVLLPLVYGTTASPLWFELRGHSAWQATPSWTVYRLACHRLLPPLRVTCAMVPDAAWPGSDQWPWSTAPAPARWVGRVAPVCPTHGVLVPSCPSSALCVRGVPSLLAPVHRCARAVCCVVFAVSWATWLLFTGVPARSAALRMQCPGPLGSRSPVCPLSVLCCVCGVPRHLAPVRRCACSVCCFACAVSWVTWLLFTGVPARSFVLFVRCSGPLGSCSPVCARGLLCSVCGFLGHLAPVHWCVRSVCCVACVASRAPWPPLTGVPARCVVLRVRCPGPLGSCSPVRSLGVLLCVRGVPGLLALVHRCARPWCLVPLLPSVHARVRCPGPRGARSPVCALCAVRLCHWWLCPSSSPPNFRFFYAKKRKTGARVHCSHTGTGSWCGGAIVLCPLVCVVGAVAAVAPLGCGSRVLMYTGMGQGGYG